MQAVRVLRRSTTFKPSNLARCEIRQIRLQISSQNVLMGCPKHSHLVEIGKDFIDKQGSEQRYNKYTYNKFWQQLIVVNFLTG